MVSVDYRNDPKVYKYASYPRTLHYSSYKNMDETERPFYGNIMYDKRVVRGNTWALRKMAQEALQAELLEERKKHKERRERVKQKLQGDGKKSGKGKKKLASLELGDTGKTTDERVSPGAQSIEGLSSHRKGEKNEAEAQTGRELLVDSSRKSDVETQIDELELFANEKSNDARENELIDELIDDSVSRAIIELEEEHKSARLDLEIEKHQDQLTARDKEVAELKELWESVSTQHTQQESRISELEEEIKKVSEEKERMMREFKKQQLKIMAEGLVGQLVPEVFANLQVAGAFGTPRSDMIDAGVGTIGPTLDGSIFVTDVGSAAIMTEEEVLITLAAEISEEFLPWLTVEADRAAELGLLSRYLSDTVLCFVSENRTAAQQQLDLKLKRFI